LKAPPSSRDCTNADPGAAATTPETITAPTTTTNPAAT